MGNNFDYARPIRYNADYRKVELEYRDSYCSDDDSNFDNSEMNKCKSSLDYDTSESSVEMESEDENEEVDQIVQNDKYLIFTTGFKTYTPHQIGINNIFKTMISN